MSEALAESGAIHAPNVHTPLCGGGPARPSPSPHSYGTSTGWARGHSYDPSDWRRAVSTNSFGSETAVLLFMLINLPTTRDILCGKLRPPLALPDHCAPFCWGPAD